MQAARQAAGQVAPGSTDLVVEVGCAEVGQEVQEKDAVNRVLSYVKLSPCRQAVGDV